MLFHWAEHFVWYTKTATLKNDIRIKVYAGAVGGDYTQWLELFAMEVTGQNDELSMCKREGVSQMRAALFVGCRGTAG